MDADRQDRATTPPGVPSDNTTLQEVLRRFADAGWGAHLWLDERSGPDHPQVQCGQCGRHSDALSLHVTAVRRLEGASDPADMLAVLAVTCPTCGASGTMVVGYGPEADEAEARFLVSVLDDTSHQGTVPRGHPR